MKRGFKITVIIVAAFVILISSGVMFIAFYKPHSLGDVEKIVISRESKLIETKKGDLNFNKTYRLIKNFINSSKFSILNSKDVKMQCSDLNVQNCKDNITRSYIEIFQPTSKYKKLFFEIDIKKENQSLIIFGALQTDTYDKGKFIFYKNCNSTELLKFIDSF